MWLDLCSGTEVFLDKLPVASSANSVSGVVNLEKPHSRQTKTLGNRKTLGLSRFLMPEKWMLISAGNTACLREPHDTQGINTPYESKTYMTKKCLSV